MTVRSLPLPPPARPSSTDGYEYAWRHASARLSERYGLTIGPIEFTRLCLDLASTPPNALCVQVRRDAERVVLNVRVQGVQTRCLFSTRDGVIVTFLPPSRSAPNPERQEANWANRQRRKVRYKRHGKHRGEAP